VRYLVGVSSRVQFIPPALLKKRLLPIVFQRVDEAQVPPRLKQLNYIFFDRPYSFTSLQ